MLNIILILIVMAFIALLVLAAMQPADFRITRTGSISAPTSAIFPHVNNLQNWDAWSPWAAWPSPKAVLAISSNSSSNS
jgi:hypothetical protein